MRYLGILALSITLSSPAVARKHRPHKRAVHVARHKPVPRLPVAPPAEPTRAEPEAPPPPRVYAAAQADDDEVPGKKHKK